MKITNEQLKKIIKEELQTVMNESSSLWYLATLAAMRKRREREAAKRKAAQQPHPRGGYKRGYGGPSSSSSYEPDPEIEKIIKQREEKAAAEEEARQQYIRDMDPSLEALAQAKLKAIQALGRDEDGDLPYMYAWGSTGDEDWLGTYYDGPLDFHEAMKLAKRAGELSDYAIDDESGGFQLDALFPGKYTQE